MSKRQGPAGPRERLTFSLASNWVPQHKVFLSLMIHLEQCLLNFSGSPNEGPLADFMPKSLILCLIDRAQLGQERD